jgi:hypothetical protein
MSKKAWLNKSSDLPNLVPELTLLARLQRENEALKRENDRLRFRMALMAAAVKRGEEKSA